MSNELRDWGVEMSPEQSQAQGSLTLDQMDAMVKAIKAARDEYKAASDAASALHERVKKAEKAVIDSLKTLGRAGYECEGVGKVSFYTKETYTTPKTNEDKMLLFEYIQEKYGAEALTGMVGINSQTLNSWANKETETGEVMQIPGLEQPSMVEVLSFRKSDK